MRENISDILAIPLDQVSVKATTTDILGFIGSRKGLAAIVIVLLKDRNGS